MSDVLAAIAAACTPTRKVEIAKAAFDRGLIPAVKLMSVIAQAKIIRTEREKPWLPWEDAIVRAGVRNGDCYETISHRLPNRTRNACLGRGRRLGLAVPDEALMLARKAIRPAHRKAPAA